MISTRDRRQSNTLLPIDERGSKIAKSVFSIAICRQLGDKWQSKNVFNYFRSSFVDRINVFDCRLSGVISVMKEEINAIQCNSIKKS